MTYHRTAGKNGTRNSAATKHPKNPNFNKSTERGESKPARKGRVEHNPKPHRTTTGGY